MEDLSKAFKKYSEDPSAPEANYFMGKRLRWPRQADQADDASILCFTIDVCYTSEQGQSPQDSESKRFIY